MQSKQPQQSRRTILIVEDDQSVFRAMQMLLIHYEFNVLLAPTIAEGRKQLAAEPDFVLLDLMLPDGLGTELLQEIRSNMKKTPGVAVITACADVSILRRAHNLKPDIMLRKPINFLDLLGRLRPLLSAA